MRFPRLTAAVAAASALAVMPALASAHVAPSPRRPAHPAGGCRVKLSVTPKVATSGEEVLVTGSLLCGSTVVGGQTVTIFEHQATIGGFHPIGTATTSPTGSFTLTPPPVVNIDSGFYAAFNGARSPTRNVRVAPLVTATPPAPEGTAFLTGFTHRVTFSGKVDPEDKGAEVALQRESGNVSEEWGVIQDHVFVQEGGTFSFTHKFSAPGDANLRIVVRPHGKFDVRGISDVMSYTVTQTQNPNLTMEPSPRPVAFGQPLVLKGITKAGAGAKVAVQGHTFEGGLVPVGETTAGAGGAWELKIPAAIQNTHYLATSGPFHSAQVYVGVKWVVAPNPVPSSVPSGTQVMFTGIAAPGNRVGHPVYLERHNQVGSGWHVVNVGFTAAGGSFSIPWFVVGSGKEPFRIKIPGDRINVATASAAMEIEVTPAAPSTPVPALEPVLPK
jgi:hypothetical protein